MEESYAYTPGFSYDRRWMLVDSSHSFLSQRAHPKMALLQTSLDHSGLFVRLKYSPETLIHIPFDAILSQYKMVRVWDDWVEACPVIPEISGWFQHHLGLACELVYMPASTRRLISAKYAVNQEYVSFADAMPYLLIGQASLEDLNSRLDQPVPMDRFRPNLVIEGSRPYEEDSWDKIRIGEVVFKLTKPCARCVLTTVDQQTAARGKEPLLTLSRYRTKNNKVLFGQNLICLSEGKVKVGDEVVISNLL